MPEFQLDIGTADHWFGKLDAFTKGYVEAIFFTSTGSMEDEGLENAHVGWLTIGTRDEIIADCKRFQEENRATLQIAYEEGYGEDQAGRDFWFTRNGHGVGFWDRAVLCAVDVANKLSDAAAAFGERYPSGSDGVMEID